MIHTLTFICFLNKLKKNTWYFLSTFPEQNPDTKPWDCSPRNQPRTWVLSTGQHCPQHPEGQPATGRAQPVLCGLRAGPGGSKQESFPGPGRGQKPAPSQAPRTWAGARPTRKSLLLPAYEPDLDPAGGGGCGDLVGCRGTHLWSGWEALGAGRSRESFNTCLGWRAAGQSRRVNQDLGRLEREELGC